MATITSHYARAALYGCKQQGHNVDQLISKAGISDSLLNRPESRVHEAQMTNLIQAVWALLNDEFMGFTASPCKPGCFAMMCELISHCNTTDAMFIKGLRFYSLVTDDIAMKYRQLENSREFVVNMDHPELDPEHFYLEFWLVIWHRLISWLIGKRIKLQSVHFAYSEPAHAKEFKPQFDCPCYFDEAETKICFSAQFSGLPPVRSQRELAHFLKRSPADLMTIPGNDDSLSMKVRSLLLTEVERLGYFPKFDDLVVDLHLSPQTARRKLKDEGSSYQKIKDATRCDIAIEKLKVQKMSINDVAELLGFSEPRSFTRAFKHWTGMTPGQYQQKF